MYDGVMMIAWCATVPIYSLGVHLYSNFAFAVDVHAGNSSLGLHAWTIASIAVYPLSLFFSVV